MSKPQDLAKFRVPDGFRGRSMCFVQLWWLVQASLFRASPQFMYRFRAALLRMFGATVGVGVLIRPRVRVTYPWKVTIGDYAWIGDDVDLYSLGEIEIGSHSVVSQRSYLCAADHDYTRTDFPLRQAKIVIGTGVWIATDVFVAPGVRIGDGAVVGARSSVFRDLPDGHVCIGTPCVPVRRRERGDV